MDKYVIVIGESLSENKLLLKLELGYIDSAWLHPSVIDYFPPSAHFFIIHMGFCYQNSATVFVSKTSF